ncbi:MAG: hypothetical protein WD016_13665 [Balneolaceae bacterium]
MKIEETVEHMSSLFLERVLRSFTNDYDKRGENKYREYIRNGIDILSSPENIKARLNNHFINNKDSYSRQILYKLVLTSLLSRSDYSSTDLVILDDVLNRQKEIVEQAKSSESFKHLDESSVKIMTAILEVALEDDVISTDELALIKKLRKKLSINEKDQFLIQAKLGSFPSKNNQKYKRSDIMGVIDDLQKCGVVFCCNNLKETVFVIPEEIIPGLKQALEIELIDSKYLLLLNKLQVKQLKQILDNANLIQSGAKNNLSARILHAGIQPSEILNSLSTTELSELCDILPGAKRSGTKDDKVTRIINYFSDLVFKNENESDDEREKYYKYFEELAARDESSLRTSEIIKKAKEISSAFEKGTCYLFETKLGQTLIQPEGSEHADGGIEFKGGNSILLWDNKGKDDGQPYKFPDSHFRQFRRYIRNEAAKGRRVGCFLIITAEINTCAIENAVRLKAESNQDTDVALISAENLKMIAEEWQNYSKNGEFNLHVFNYTGILDRESLKMRVKTLS